MNPFAFWGMHFTQASCAYHYALQAMVTIPTPIFCASPDPCSCIGGGFDLYTPICDEIAAAKGRNSTANSTTSLKSINMTAARGQYSTLFDFLGKDMTTVFVSIGVIIIIGVVFALLRLLRGMRKAEKDRDVMKKMKDDIDLERRDLLEQNEKIQQQLALTALSEEQAEIVHAGAAALEDDVPERFKIDSSHITFEALLGSGSFGDCYKGSFHNVKVAVKQMRVVRL